MATIHHVPPRPTTANPEHTREQIGKAVREIDEDIDFLFLLHEMLLRCPEVPDQAVSALETIHKRMKQQTNVLFMLM